jgi:nicotinate-nucleotide adenylyltransferase
MKLGVFGGSFDPVHMGHLILAEQCREQAQLDRVLFVPAARPPHKPDRELTPFHIRAEMLTLAISGNPAFQVDELENDRPGPSYTVLTLEALKARDPDAELWLILGGDSLVDLPLWYQPKRIFELAGLLIVGRPGWPAPSVADLKKNLSLADDFSLRALVVECPLIEIASRELRRRIADGKSVRYQLPRAVEAYLADKKLYAKEQARSSVGTSS